MRLVALPQLELTSRGRRNRFVLGVIADAFRPLFVERVTKHWHWHLPFGRMKASNQCRPMFLVH